MFNSTAKFGQKEHKSIIGFTLAEVLIALVIIGVIAAISIDVLNKRLQEQYIVRLKKMYSVLSQATNLAIANDGPMELWELPEGGGSNATEVFVKNYVSPYLINAKDCGSTSTESCSFKYKYLNETQIKQWANDWYKIALNDGSTAVFQASNNGTEWSWVLVTTDVNGDKGPNRFARDIYTFVYWLKRPDSRSGKFEAYGLDWSRDALVTTQNSNACNKSSSGQLCAALLMKDNWQMKKDYPY